MVYEVGKIFEDVAYLSKVHTKKDYENQMNMFKENRYDLLSGLIDSNNLEVDAVKFCEDVTEEFKKFGKVRGGDLMNLNYFMIYYVFPAILLNEDDEKAVRICDTLRDTWNNYFKSNISYTDYATLMDGFQMKIFGIPIGKN